MENLSLAMLKTYNLPRMGGFVFGKSSYSTASLFDVAK
jgi:hypothetical protein